MCRLELPVVWTFSEEILDRTQYDSHWWYEINGVYDYPGEEYDTVTVYYHRLDYDKLYYRDTENRYGIIGIIPAESPERGEELYRETNQDDSSEYRKIVFEEFLDSLVVADSIYYDVLVESIENYSDGEMTFRDTH